jgi:hypothetical protein
VNQEAEVRMTTALLTVWCVSSFLVAPLVGRAIRAAKLATPPMTSVSSPPVAEVA